MKLTGVRAMIGKVMAIGLVAGAFALVAPAKAEAQQYGPGDQIGPGYSDGGQWDGYNGGRYERRREAIAQQEAWQRHQAHEQHERWEHAREGGRGYDRDGDRGYGQNVYPAPYGYAGQGGYYGR